MGLGNLFKSLFAGSGSGSDDDKTKKTAQAVAETEEYKGLTIEAAPIKEGSQFRTAGFISGELDGQTCRVPFIRADNSTDQQAAVDHSLAKGRQIIDEQGSGLLSRTHL